MNAKPAMSFLEKEKICEYNFLCNSPYWHLCTDGNKVPIMFHSSDDMVFTVNLMCICACRCPDIKILTFEIMNNHIHAILSGKRERCQELFCLFRSRLQRFFIRNGRCIDLSGFECQVIPIADLNSLRNEIAYVNRNGFLVHSGHTPFSYPWGSNSAFFNPVLKQIPTVSFDALPVKTKRHICRSHDMDFDSKSLRVNDYMILPSSICDITLAENMFRDAHHYFHLISRNFESYTEIAKRLHESVFLTDEELYAAVSSVCHKTYGTRQPSLLAPKEKLEMAKKMHYDYNATNRQIKSILKLEMHVIDQMFPIPGRQ